MCGSSYSSSLSWYEFGGGKRTNSPPFFLYAPAMCLGSSALQALQLRIRPAVQFLPDEWSTVQKRVSQLFQGMTKLSYVKNKRDSISQVGSIWNAKISSSFERFTMRLRKHIALGSQWVSKDIAALSLYPSSFSFVGYSRGRTRG